MNKLDRVNKGKWWRMDHSDGCWCMFTVTVCVVVPDYKTPENVKMRLTVHGPHEKVNNHVVNNSITLSLAHMRDEWDRLTKRGFVYNGD